MAKCPWCPSEIEPYKLGNCYGHKCPKGCYSAVNKLYATESEALSAASKRFMPKRTVEEICAFLDKSVNTQEVEYLSLSETKQNECQDFFDAVRATRISDFITGANGE